MSAAVINPLKDRTSDFRGFAQRVQKQQGIPDGGVQQPPLQQQRSQFASSASQIGLSIQRTSTKLQKLLELSKRTNLMFNDPAEEINQLTGIIKQDIQALNLAIAQLQQLGKQAADGSGGNKQQQDAHTVVDHLRSRLKDATAEFKDVLTLRTDNLKANNERRQLFSSEADASRLLEQAPLLQPHQQQHRQQPSHHIQQQHHSSFSGVAGASGSSRFAPPHQQQQQQQPLLPVPGVRPAYGSPNNPSTANRPSAADLFGGAGAGGVRRRRHDEPHSPAGYGNSSGSSAVSGGAQPQQLQQQYAPQETGYTASRAAALSNVETTIVELGSIFTQLAELVASQGEMTQRIDENVEDTLHNVDSAKQQLMKYLNTISSNRWLMLKVLGVLLVFLIIFIVVVG